MIELQDITEECDDKKHHESFVGSYNRVAVHRIWFNDWPDPAIEKMQSDDLTTRMQLAIAIARRFIYDPIINGATGSENAYTFLVDPAGTWWQCLPLADAGRHAARWNSEAVGVGCIGNFLKHPMPQTQSDSLAEGLSYLCQALEINPVAEDVEGVPYVAGHDELPGGSKDPNKKCPGDIGLSSIKQTAATYIAERGRQALLQQGMIISWS